jgi:hypothetical protein
VVAGHRPQRLGHYREDRLADLAVAALCRYEPSPIEGPASGADAGGGGVTASDVADKAGVGSAVVVGLACFFEWVWRWWYKVGERVSGLSIPPQCPGHHI